MNEPVLVVLAAGMGSRYGGLKQIDTVGDNGECIIDFSIYDAYSAGFRKVVLIIRKEHEEAFNKALCDKVRNPKFPYLIGQDLVRIRVTVSGPKHWDMICTRVPELGWVKRNSTLTGEMFRIAKMHPGLVLRFGIDFPKYCKKIEKAAEELGIDIDHKPLVCYQWSKKTGEKYKDIELAPVKTKADYLSALLETEQSKTVQSEIKEVKNK
jgi:hypothetical protein